MRTTNEAAAVSTTELMAEARRLQATHGARVMGRVVRKLRQGLARVAQADPLGSAARLRLH